LKRWAIFDHALHTWVLIMTRL